MAANTPLNPTRADYTPDALIVCKRVLGTLVKRVGQYGPQIVVIGGLVPTLLLPQGEPKEFTGEPHSGTNDVDLVLDLRIPTIGDEAFYTRLEQVLTEGEFRRLARGDGHSESVWQWVKRVDDITIGVEFLGEQTTQQEKSGNARPIVSRIAADEPTQPWDEIGALRIRGAHLAYDDCVPRDLHVDLLDNGGKAIVNVFVANLLPFIALKAFAIRNREKDKDAADLVWILNNWDGGAAGAAIAAWQSCVRNDDDVADALTLLRTDFSAHDREGCCRYARFRLGKAEDPKSDNWIRECRYAHGTVNEFFEAWERQG